MAGRPKTATQKTKVTSKAIKTPIRDKPDAPPLVKQRMYELHEVRNILKCGHTLILNMINRNQLEAINIASGGRPCYRIPESALENFLEARKVAEERRGTRF